MACPSGLSGPSSLRFFIVAGELLGPKSAKWVVAALLLGGLSQVALGAYQFMRQAGPAAFILPSGFMRAYGTFDQPNPYAGYLGYLAPVAASLSIWALARWWRRAQCSNGHRGAGIRWGHGARSWRESS